MIAVQGMMKESLWICDILLDIKGDRGNEILFFYILFLCLFDCNPMSGGFKNQ